MLEVNELLTVAGIPLNARGPESLRLRFAELESKINLLFSDTSPRILDHIPLVERSALWTALQPTGALERFAWLVVHQAAGDDQEVATLQCLVDSFLESWVILLALSRHGGIHGLDPLSDEALAGTRDWLTRTASTTMSFFWINYVICAAIVEIVGNDSDWRHELPSFIESELIGLMRWSATNLHAKKPLPLVQEEAGFQLGSRLATLSPAANQSLRHLFQERSLTSAPLRETDDGLILATPRTFPTRAYVALLELADAQWKAGPPRKNQSPRDKGALFERAVQRIIEYFFHDSDAGMPPFALKLVSGKDTDLDICWKIDDLWIIGECKGYSPGVRADDSFTKLDEEISRICEQLTVRTQALHALRPVRSKQGEFLLGQRAELIRLGVVLDTAHSLAFREDEFGLIHIFTIEGLVAMLGAMGEAAQIHDYLAFRVRQLEKGKLQDECDLLIAFIKGLDPQPHELRQPGAFYFQPESANAWRKFLAAQPTPVT